MFPRNDELIYPPSAKWPKTETNKRINAKLSFFHLLIHFSFLSNSALLIFSEKSFV